MESENPARRLATDADLWKLASCDPGSKSEATRLLRSHGFRANDATAAAVLSRAAEIELRRRDRPNRRILARLGHLPPPSPARASGRPPVLLPQGSPAQRLLRRRVNAVARAARSVLRHGAAGGHTMRVQLTNDPSAVGYTVTIDRNFTTYRGAFKGWAAREDHHVINVPADWRVRVERKGLATLGGMLTLDAHELTGQAAGIRVFAAVWARQARGYQVEVERGYIAVSGEESYHGATPDAAVRGLRRKVAAAGQWTDEGSIARFVARYQRYRHLTITLDDARATGSCEYGIRAWCEAVGLPYDNGSATIGQVLDAYPRRPQIEVRRAVIHAVRRNAA